MNSNRAPKQNRDILPYLILNYILYLLSPLNRLLTNRLNSKFDGVVYFFLHGVRNYVQNLRAHTHFSCFFTLCVPLVNFFFLQSISTAHYKSVSKCTL